MYHENCMCRFTITVLKSKDIVYGDSNKDLSPGDAVGSIFKIICILKIATVYMSNVGLDVNPFGTFVVVLVVGCYIESNHTSLG